MLAIRRALGILFLGVATLAGAQDATRPMIILLGPPMSGKTELLAEIQKAYGIPGISIEDLINDHAQELRDMHPEGLSMAEMRTDPAMSRYVKQQFGKMDLSRGVVLDGYPATTLQGQDLAQMIREMKFMPLVLQMTLPDDLVRKRAAKGGRDSDSPEIINQRLKDYHREFDNASIYFPNAKIVKIDASHADADAWKAAQAALDAQGIKP